MNKKSKIKLLIQKLIECEKFFIEVGDTIWSNKIHCVLEKVDKIDSQDLVKEVLSWYQGTMGSFGDLIICEINGHIVTTENEDELDEKMSILRSDIYVLAHSYSRPFYILGEKLKSELLSLELEHTTKLRDGNAS